MACSVCVCVRGSVYDMSWWGSWFGLLVGGTLIWHALAGTALPSYSTDSHCPGNRSSSSRTQYTRNLHTHTFTQTHTTPLEAVFFLISLWDWWGQMGEQWESGLPSLEKQRHARTNSHISHTQTHTGSQAHPDLVRKWQTYRDATMHTEKSNSLCLS